MFLLWWSLTALGIYSWAGEKMPWLLVHVALPMVLLSAWAFQQIVTAGIDAFRQRFTRTDDDTPAPSDPLLPQMGRALLMFGAGFLLVAGIAFIRMTVFVGATDQSANTGALIVLMFTAMTGLLVVAASQIWGWRWSFAALTVCLTLFIGLYTVRSSYRINYLSGDVPRDALIYTQTSPDVARVVNRLEAISELRTRGLEMPIIYDNETVWQWYLRDFTNATRTGPQLSSAPGPEVQAVLMLQENLDRYSENRNLLEQQGFVLQRYPLRWWFPEGQIYDKRPDWREAPLDQVSLLSRAMRAPLDNETLARAWEFMVYRDPGAPLGSTDFVLAVRPEIADQIGPGVGGSQ
ncbi:MAG: hypothetical protein HC914_09925 [Chloroflexaceae bacterium]|nr:hypothetical protein [Chloroflexaceae bacterium]